MSAELAVVCTRVAVRHDRSSPPVLDDISFTIRAGERVALAGLNGAGKTTMLLALVGLVPHDGDILIGGQRLTRRSIAGIRRRIGFLFNVPEDQLLFPTAVEDVSFDLVRRGTEPLKAGRQARHHLQALGVGEVADQPLHHLSHGQKQRVALAGATAANPELLLLDEPTAGLDPPGRRQLADLLSTQPATLIIATHDLDFVDRLCTRVMLLERGTVIDDAPGTEGLRARWGC